MKLLIDDFAELHQVATDDVADRSADGFARVHQDSSGGWTWTPHPMGVSQFLPTPIVPYLSKRAAYYQLHCAITALLREGLKELKCAE